MATFEPSPDLDPAVAQAIQQAMDALRAELRPELARGDLQDAPPAATAVGAGDRLQTLEEAVGAIDLATSQTDLLGELLQQAGKFAERTLFLVLADGRYGGWAAYGFAASPDDVTRVSIDADDEPWRRVAEEGGIAELDGEACDGLVRQLAAESAADGVVVGFSLRGRTAGALYADRLTAGGTLEGSPLRILTYLAAQALETLPLRRGHEPAPLVEDTAVEDTAVEDTAVEDTGIGEPAAAVHEDETPPAIDVDVHEMIQEVEPDAGLGHEIVEIRRGPEPVELEPELPAEPGLAPEPDLTPSADGDQAAGALDELDEVGTSLDAEVELAAPEDETAAEPELDDVTFATQQISTLDVTLGDEGHDQADSPRPIKLRPIEPAEVAPPDDLEGPGWAFGGPGTISDDTRHEEARRLARLLVTEIKLYNEEKVREGRENNNLLHQLRDDLDRSRRIYEERIDDEIRDETDYFHEECVRILAGGDSTALGA